jgi:hypothetical protein
MNLGKFIFERLTTDPVLSGLIGNRVYPIFAAQGASMPNIVYFLRQEIYEEPKGCAIMFNSEIVFHLWADANFGAEGYDTLNTIDSRIFNIMHNYSGNYEGKNVYRIVYINSYDSRDDLYASYLRIVRYQARHD